MPRKRVIPALIGGPYRAPALRVGDVATCLYRDCDVRITCWTDAPISWPRGGVIGQSGGSGLLVDEELLRAIRTESALALRHWWGVGEGTVWRSRRAFGVGMWGTKGSRLLHVELSQKGAEASRGRAPSVKELAQRVATRMTDRLSIPRDRLRSCAAGAARCWPRVTLGANGDTGSSRTSPKLAQPS